MFTHAMRVVTAGLLCVGLFGCSVSSQDCTGPHPPTLGEELSDLKNARDDGALNEEQYEEARRKLLSRLDKPPER